MKFLESNCSIKTMKDLMFEYDLCDKAISEQTGVSVDTIKMIKAGDLSVSFEDWYLVSCFVNDFYVVNVEELLLQLKIY